MAEHQVVRAGVLDVAYERHGEPGGWPVVLLHGFPYDVRCYDEVVPQLAGADVVVPYLRGYGPTRYVSPETPRSGQQAALAHDLVELVDALGLEKPVVAGYDWGGRAACLVAMLWPSKVSGLVTAGGYNVQDIAAGQKPKTPAVERTLWYQYYLHGQRGRDGLAQNRAALARLLWREWSPTWDVPEELSAQTVRSFDNPDFVEVVVHSYRHRFGLVPGDPQYQPSEDRVAAQPTIDVPTVVVDGAHDTVNPPKDTAEHARHFTRLVAHRLLDAGHCGPAEDPDAFAQAVLDVRAAR